MKRVVLRRAWCLAPAAGVLAALALALAGCGGSAQQSEGSHQQSRPAGLGVDRTLASHAVHRCASGRFVPSPSLAYAAVAHGPTPVRTGPGGTSHVVARYPAVDQNGFKTVFAVVGARVHGCRPLWFHVLLPSRPNGSSAWVSASDVRVYTVSSRVVVDLSSPRISLYRWGNLEFSAAVAVGAPGTPTPVGRFYVDERFLLASANGPFGVAALGISAHSDALKNWVQGGPVALHGTDEPSLIGGAVSHGCVRLTNTTMMRVFRLAPAGTPVLIRR